MRTPQASSVRATKHPSVPAPRSKQRVLATRSRSKEGRIRQRMSFRFKSTAWSASLAGSIIGARSARRGASFPCGFFSQPTALGRVGTLVAAEGLSCTEIVPKRLFHFPEVGTDSVSLQHRTRTLRCWEPGVVNRVRNREVRKASRLRSGQPGWSECAEGSMNPIMASWAGRDARDDKGETSNREGSFGLERRTKNGGVPDDDVAI